jgi:hypothetical protein
MQDNAGKFKLMEFGVGARGVALNLRGSVRDQLFVRIN